MRIFITGINGQDGSILAEKHLNNGDEVWGSVSPGQSGQNIRSKDVNSLFTDNFQKIEKVLDEIKPDRIYHLATKHFASTDDKALNPKLMKEMYDCHVEITRDILEWQVLNPTSKSLIALTSQMYSPKIGEYIINEQSQCAPQNYYAETKHQAKNLLHSYRRNHQVNTYGAILFNHTSLRSRHDFLFPYLAREMAKLICGRSREISLRNPGALLDISHAQEVCDGMYNLLDYNVACDLVFSSGKLVSIKDLIEKTLSLLDFKGEYSLTTSGIYQTDQIPLMGDPSLAEKLINWKVKLSPEEILKEHILKVVNN